MSTFRPTAATLALSHSQPTTLPSEPASSLAAASGTDPVAPTTASMPATARPSLAASLSDVGPKFFRPPRIKMSANKLKLRRSNRIRLGAQLSRRAPSPPSGPISLLPSPESPEIAAPSVRQATRQPRPEPPRPSAGPSHHSPPPVHSPERTPSPVRTSSPSSTPPVEKLHKRRQTAAPPSPPPPVCPPSPPSPPSTPARSIPPQQPPVDASPIPAVPFTVRSPAVPIRRTLPTRAARAEGQPLWTRQIPLARWILPFHHH